MTPRNLLVGIAAMLALAAGMGSYAWHMRSRVRPETAASYAQPVQPPAAGRAERVTLFVAHDDPGVLVEQPTVIALPEGRQQRAEELLRTLLKQYLDKSSPHTLGAGSEVRDVYLVDPGLAVIDLNADFANSHRSGVLVEELTVASLVQTLAANDPGILRVKILVEGQGRDTLAGHADLADVYDVMSVSQMVNALKPEEQ